jgi:micrococcal nuclease
MTDTRTVVRASTSDDTVPLCGTRIEGAIPAGSANDHVGEWQAVEFRVARTKDTGRVTFLNSHDPYQGHFYVAVFPGDYAHFEAPPDQLFDGRCIVVQGKIELYRNSPQIILRLPDDVRILED